MSENVFEEMDVSVVEFFEILDKIVTNGNNTGWTADDEINARIVEATEGMNCLSHTGC